MSEDYGHCNPNVTICQDGWMIMNGCVQWNSIYGLEDITLSEDQTRSVRTVGQRLTH